jgi:hypothetical protein
MSSTPERRKNLSLRELVDKAYVIIEPFFDPANAWNGQSLEHLAYHVVREQLPDIAPQDAQVIVSAATRIYRSKHQDPSKPLVTRLYPLLFVLLWSTGFIGAKYGLPYAEPLSFLSARYVLVIAIMGMVALVTRAPWPSLATPVAAHRHHRRARACAVPGRRLHRHPPRPAGGHHCPGGGAAAAAHRAGGRRHPG